MGKFIRWAAIVAVLAINVLLMIDTDRLFSNVSEPEEHIVVSPSQPVVSESIVEEPPMPDPVAGYTVAKVDVCAEPVSSSDVMATLPAHSDVEYIDTAEGWSRIMLNGEIGYVAEGTVREKGESNGLLICIDPGHQLRGNKNKEPVGPGSYTLKAKVSYGTSGKTSGVQEYEFNLDLSLKLQKELEYRGYEVLLTRTTHEVNISNSERAVMANEANADAFIRVHANSNDNPEINGAHTICQSADNRHNGEMHEPSMALSLCIVNDLCAATGLKNNSAYTNDFMTGINWCKVPVTLLEVGYMSNPSDDLYMTSEEGQYCIVVGVANGIDRFFAGDKY